jgi:hypothetical protein
MHRFNWVIMTLAISVSLPFAEHAAADPVPTDPNLVLWMRADQGVTAPGGLVTKIEDSSDNDNDMLKGGNPMLSTQTFPTGDHPVIHFGGAAALWVPNTTALNLQNASIYMVASEQFGFFTSQCFIANYGPAFVGYAVGISDTQQNTIKFYTSHGTFQSSQEPITVPDETPFLLTTTFTETGSKNLYYNSGPGYHEDGAYPTYAPTNQFTIGGLDWNGSQNDPGGENFNQDIIGNIAEILIFDNINDAQRADVEAYLNRKYFITGNADFNNSGKVDGADFLIWQRNLASGTTHATGDANGDNVVDSQDLTVIKAYYGAASTALSSAVPEPAACTLAAGGLLAAMVSARTFRRSGSRRSF